MGKAEKTKELERSSLEDMYLRLEGEEDGEVYCAWENVTDGESKDPASGKGIVINLRWWYPAWVVGLITRWKLRMEKQ